MNEIKIDKGIPEPVAGTKFRKYPWDTMEIGDSFFAPTQQRGLYSCAQRQGIKITIRKEGDGIRVWRIA